MIEWFLNNLYKTSIYLSENMSKRDKNQAKPELLAPAGSMTMLAAAIDSGADSVYFGIKQLNMRATAKNFELSNMRKAVDRCHKNGVKAYLTLNTIVYSDEIPKVRKIIAQAKKDNVDAVIAWDMAVVNAACEAGIPVHLSTQASCANFESAVFYKNIGVKRIVLARECTLEDVSEIKKKSGIEIEAFVHGAMCVSVSGRCFLSQSVFGRSANRGDCLQPCRRSYTIKDSEEGFSYELGENYVMSPKDLCSIEFIDRLIESGLDCFKIEGRAKDPEYVKTVVSCYREAIDAYHEGRYDEALKKTLKDRLQGVFNRGFSDGFFFGRPISDFTDSYGPKTEGKKSYVGRIKKFYSRINVAELIIQSSPISVGDHIQIQGPTTGVMDFTLSSIESEHRNLKRADKGMRVGIKCSGPARPNDLVFLIHDQLPEEE
jgi:putative protease